MYVMVIVHTSNTAALHLTLGGAYTNFYTIRSTSRLSKGSTLASTLCLVTILYSQDSNQDL